MPKFIELQDLSKNNCFINTDHIVFVLDKPSKNRIVLTINEPNTNAYYIETEMNYDKIKELITSE